MPSVCSIISLFHLLRIWTLDMSVDGTLCKKDREVRSSVVKMLAPSLPNLLHVNLSNAVIAQPALSDFARRCTSLEAIVWKNHSTSANFVG